MSEVSDTALFFRAFWDSTSSFRAFLFDLGLGLCAKKLNSAPSLSVTVSGVRRAKRGRKREGKDYQASCSAYQKGPEGLLAGLLPAASPAA